MNAHRGELGGVRLTGRTRIGELGTWSSALSADGRPGGALRFDPRLVADPAARDRLVAAVVADRKLAQGGPAGLLPVADLVAAHDEIWLITSDPADPTVTDLLAGAPGAPRPDAGSAAVVLVETAQTLLAVHAAGLAHGSLHPGTVVIAADGTALLAERGLADALHGRPAAPERDVAAWAALARGLAATWAAGDLRSAELFERAATAASTHGLAAARDALLAGRDLLPRGFPTRDRLVETLHRWAARDAASPVAPPAPAPAAPHGRGAEGADEGDIVTLLHVPTSGRGRTDDASGRGRTDDVVMRFGPGVPVETTAEQIWRAGRDQQETVLPAGRPDRPGGLRASRARAGRRRTVVSTATLALMVVVALVVWLLRGAAQPLAVEEVDVVAPKKAQGCDTTVRIRGVLTTNGEAGEIRYQWKRSDRKAPIEQSDTVEAGRTSHEVSLEWTVKGEGSFKGTATLRLLSPVPEGAKLEDRASFTYRCS
ncbi:hypothetical protein [Planomonospora venezuelensis]|uniref:Uncharacterized protein n=1 Tax=Planomonospora venezuelensis TaxID=1999 RepID=A0A841CY20_PLAVE|nr:hypothetical protein [Planomonospora venezuelensis]MBB5962320.1 hypothetical protein [Planomonospora venezuelensis]GIN00700.1 hypothetical protein Pve01_23580 [Planomonospora venezuelensis]